MSPRSSPRPARRATQPVPVKAQPPAPPAPVSAAPQQPGLFGQMAATAGGVAVGSAIVSSFAAILIFNLENQYSSSTSGDPNPLLTFCKEAINVMQFSLFSIIPFYRSFLYEV